MGYILGYIFLQSTAIPLEISGGLFRNIEDSQELTGVLENPGLNGVQLGQRSGRISVQRAQRERLGGINVAHEPPHRVGDRPGSGGVPFPA